MLIQKAYFFNILAMYRIMMFRSQMILSLQPPITQVIKIFIFISRTGIYEFFHSKAGPEDEVGKDS